MITFNGKPTYSKAFLLFGKYTRNKCSKYTFTQLMNAGSLLNFHVKETPDLPADRPLWLFCIAHRITIASPKKAKVQIETVLPQILGDKISFLDLSTVRNSIKDITVNYDGCNPVRENFTPGKLTMQQVIQLLSIGKAYPPSTITLKFSTNPDRGDALEGYFAYQPPGKKPLQYVERGLCHNIVLGGITQPLRRNDFSRIKFADSDELFDTVFELDRSLIT